MLFPKVEISVPLLSAALFCLAPSSLAQTISANQEEHIRKIEATAVNLSLDPNEAPLQMKLDKLMELFNVTGLSIAVIDDYKIAWAKGYGVTDMVSNKPVTTKTLFQAGSISKPVAATGALHLVEQGKLSLDEDVNQELKTWKVPENEFTKTEKVTLRRLMSHTAGLTVHGFPGYDVDAPLPTLVQILNGEKPANTEPIRVESVPGAKENYSGGGITIEQQLMIDVTGKPFPEFMRESVLEKIGMKDSSYQQPLPANWASRTATGTFMDGKPVHGRWHVYPEMAAAGLWTTPTDLAMFAIEITLSKQGKANHALSKKMTNEMLTPVLGEAGLGFFLEKKNPGQFDHNGADEGFQAILTMNTETGKGVVIMANSDFGIAIGDALVRSIANEYGWGTRFEEGYWLPLIYKARGTQAALQRYVELKKNPNFKVDESTLNNLGYTLLYSGETQDAITVFKRNVQEYPESSNVYDSLGESYMKAGQKELAIANYEKSLQLDPKNQNALEMLRKIKQSN